jgi:release factor glutamine methyltransferase
MVRLAVDLMRPHARPRCLDLGCGTGAIGAAVAAAVPGAEVWAVDVDPAAVACARRNLPADRVLEGDLYQPLRAGLRFDVVLANAPYVPTDEIALMPPEARHHEHRVALDGGPDGLDVQRRAITGASGRLEVSGAILVETSRRQAEATAALMTDAGLTPRIHVDDDIAATVVVGRTG